MENNFHVNQNLKRSTLALVYPNEIGIDLRRDNEGYKSNHKRRYSLSDIDINKLIEDNLKIKVDNLILMTEGGYIVFSTNLSDL